MFDLGWSELLIVAIVALIVIGPKELPGVLRSIGYWIGKVRRMASEFQGQFNEAMREAEMADLKKQVDELTDTSFYSPEFDALGDLQSEIEKKPDTDKKSDEKKTDTGEDNTSTTGAADAVKPADEPAVAAPIETVSDQPSPTEKPATPAPARSGVEVVPIASSSPSGAGAEAAEPGAEPKPAGSEGRRTA